MIFDTVIHNGTIITVNPDFDIIENGVVCINNSEIQDVITIDNAVVPEAKVVVDAGGGIIMPGLINTHTHLPMSLFRGLADDLPLMTWLNDYIFPAESRHISPESVKIGTRISCAEMILSGTTTCCDGYFLEEHVAQTVYESGMRGVLAQGLIDYPAPGVADPKENIRHAVEFTEKWLNKDPSVIPSIFCHSPYTCSPETLQKAKQAANDHSLLFQIHVAETRAEVDQMRSEHQKTPVQYLDELGILDDRTLLVHAVYVDENDIDIIGERCASVAHTPESNMKLASGIAPVPSMITRNIPVGLGTDGSASNNDLDLFAEMDTAAKLHKMNAGDPTVMNAEAVLKMATINGAKAIGLDSRIGSIEKGKQADIIIVDTKKPHLVPMYNPVSHLVYAVRGADVRDLFVAGKALLRNRQLLTIDIEDILMQGARIAAAIG